MVTLFNWASLPRPPAWAVAWISLKPLVVMPKSLKLPTSMETPASTKLWPSTNWVPSVWSSKVTHESVSAATAATATSPGSSKAAG